MSVEETKKYEKDREKNRKKTSLVRGSVQNPNTNCGREEQRKTTIIEGQPNLGSNRNMGRKHESEDAPEHQPQGGFSYSPDQYERDHSQAPVVEKGAIDNRSTKKTKASERHVTSQSGFDVAKRRHSGVAANRKETERTCVSRRKRSSSV